MKNPTLKLIAIVTLAVLAGVGVYFWKTASMRAMMCCDKPELVWLQHEFKVDAKDMGRVAELHQAYLTQCGELCERIAATNSLAREQLRQDGQVTPAVEKLLNDAAQLRVECQKNMLGYFAKMSAAMPPAEGRRYMAWMEARIFTMSHEPMEPSETEHHHHGE